MKLYPDQEQAIEGARTHLRAGHKRIVLAAPTGAGKTVMSAALIKAAIERGTKSLFLCERRVLVGQAVSMLQQHGLPYGVLMSKHERMDRYALVQVASVQTLEKMYDWPDFDCVFIDEIHACMRQSVIAMFERFPRRPVIGLTATPFHPLIPEYFSAHVNAASMAQLVEAKRLVPFRVFCAQEIDVTGVKVVAGEWNKAELEKRGLKVVGDIVNDYLRLVHEVWKGVPPKTICFSAGVDHGASLVDKFREVGINAVQISYRDSEEFKTAVLKDFKAADTEIQVVISADILTRGYDQTDVQHVILARPLRKSFSSHVQMVGRGARVHGGKEYCVVQDHSGNWLRFLDDWTDLYNNGVQTLDVGLDAKARKEKTPEEKAKAKCPKCGALWTPGSDTCAHCGHVRERRNRVMAMPGELVEMDAGRRAADEEQRRWYAQLRWYAADRNWKPAWAWHQYRTKFGSNPPSRYELDAPSPPDHDVQNWARSQIIRWAKSQHRRAA